jgi:2'-5' RNA ligase
LACFRIDTICSTENFFRFITNLLLRKSARKLTLNLDHFHQVTSGRPRPARPFTPHLTLLRDRHLVPEHDISPIEWEVREIVLVHSLLGRTVHRHLARVPLA